MDMERIAESQRMTETGSCFIFRTELLSKKYGAIVHVPNRGRMKCGRMQEHERKRGNKKMTGRNVTVILATKISIHRMPGPAAKKRRIAGHARVLTNKDEQYASYKRKWIITRSS